MSGVGVLAVGVGKVVDEVAVVFVDVAIVAFAGVAVVAFVGVAIVKVHSLRGCSCLTSVYDLYDWWVCQKIYAHLRAPS